VRRCGPSPQRNLWRTTIRSAAAESFAGALLERSLDLAKARPAVAALSCRFRTSPEARAAAVVHSV